MTSVGGQDTYANDVNFEKLSKSLGFKKFIKISNTKNLKEVESISFRKKLSFLEVKVSSSKIKNFQDQIIYWKLKKQFME